MRRRSNSVVLVMFVALAGCGRPAPPPPPVETTVEPLREVQRDPTALPRDLGLLRRATVVLEPRGDAVLFGTGSHFLSISGTGEYTLVEVSDGATRTVGGGRLPGKMSRGDLVAAQASGRLIALESDSGTVLLGASSGDEIFRWPSAEGVTRGVYVTHDLAVTTAVDKEGTTLAVVSASGKELWRSRFQGEFVVLGDDGQGVLRGARLQGRTTDLIDLALADGTVRKHLKNVVPTAAIKTVEHHSEKYFLHNGARVYVLDADGAELWTVAEASLITGAGGLVRRKGAGRYVMLDLGTGAELWSVGLEIGWRVIAASWTASLVALHVQANHLHLVVLADRVSGAVTEVLDAGRPDALARDARRVRVNGSAVVDFTRPTSSHRDEVALVEDVSRWLPHRGDRTSEAGDRLRRLGSATVRSMATEFTQIAAPAGLLAAHEMLDDARVVDRLLVLARQPLSPADAEAVARLASRSFPQGATAPRYIETLIAASDRLFEEPTTAENSAALDSLIAAFYGFGAAQAMEVPGEVVERWLSTTLERMRDNPGDSRASGLETLAWTLVRVARGCVRKPSVELELLSALQNFGLAPLHLGGGRSVGRAEALPRGAVYSSGGDAAVFTRRAAGICVLLGQRRVGSSWSDPLFLSELVDCELKDVGVTVSERAIRVSFLKGDERRLMGWRWDDVLADEDHDGWSDAFEELFGTSPKNPDSDGDGIADGVDVAPSCAATAPAPASSERRAVFLSQSFGRPASGYFMSLKDCVQYVSSGPRVFHMTAKRLASLQPFAPKVRVEEVGPDDSGKPAVTKSWFAKQWNEAPKKRVKVTVGDNSEVWVVAEVFARPIAIRR